jgi:DNA/RNA-binding domain of Phe-tRNA-synthetase-like protein
LEIYIDDSLKENFSDLSLGVIRYQIADIEETHWLNAKLKELCMKIENSYSINEINQIPSVRDLKGIYRKVGIDPNRYRISSDALLRRVIQGKGLYKVNQIIDFNNYISLMNKIPVGSYDLDSLSGPVVFRLGKQDEIFESIAKRELRLEKMPLFSDLEGPFGTMTSDSLRTKITNQTKKVMLVMISPTSDRLILRVENCVNDLQKLNMKVLESKII